MTSALIFGAVIATAYIVILVLIWRFQERIVFQPPGSPESSDLGSGTMEYTSSDGVRLIAHVVDAGRPGAPVILAFHGNAMISRWMIPWAREAARRLGATVVLPEYRGYDGLSGVPTYEGARRDAAAALDAVEKRYGLRPSQMVFYGHSLGSAIVTELAAANPPRVLVLESPFTSARDMAPPVGIGFFWGVISRVHYDTRRHVAALDVPVHVAHGERDIIVPVRQGRAVHAAARRQGGLLVLPKAGHNDVAGVGGDAYWRWMAEAVAAPAR
jgi:hypothetical protein